MNENVFIGTLLTPNGCKLIQPTPEHIFLSLQFSPFCCCSEQKKNQYRPYLSSSTLASREMLYKYRISPKILYINVPGRSSKRGHFFQNSIAPTKKLHDASTFDI